MIVRPVRDRLHLITQPDHAHLARLVMEHCVSLRVSPRRADVLHAIGEHDNGWAEEDAAPAVDPATGGVVDFVSASLGVRHSVWPRAISRLSTTPYAAALVAQHAITVYERFRSDPRWTTFFTEMAALRDAMLQASGNTPEVLAADYPFVRLGDLISLMFCTGWAGEQRFGDWVVSRSGARVVVTPDPFGGVTVPVAIPVTEIRQGPFRDDAALREAVSEGEKKRVRGAVAGTSRERRPTRVFVTDTAYYEDRAEGLVSAHRSGVPQALAQIREWHPAFADATDERIRQASFDTEVARLVYARQHGVESWGELIAHVESVATGERIEPFRDAFDAMRGRRWRDVTDVIQRHTDVLRARGTNGNTLLNLAISLAGRSCEPLPAQVWQLLDTMLQSGAAVDEPNDRGWTPLHQAAYANQPELARWLMDAGAAADREAHGEGGTPLAVALFWGHREVADVLAAVAVIPENLRIAAGLGRVDLVDRCFESDGSVTAAARAGRRFYRPHSGFPVWHPSDDRQEILDEALVWASKADRVEVLPVLVARGARIDADPYRGTPLIWAAANNRLAAAQWLLDHGAPISPATFGGPSHGEGVTPLHLAAQHDHLEMARLLLDRGADPTIHDAIHGSTAAGWAAHFGSRRVQELLAMSGRAGE